MWRYDRQHAFLGLVAVDPDGARLGRVRSVLYDPETALDWVVVETGPLGRRLCLAPAHDARPVGGRLRLSVQRAALRRAPRLLDPEDATRGQSRSAAYRHHGLIGLPRRRGPLAHAANAA